MTTRVAVVRADAVVDPVGYVLAKSGSTRGEVGGVNNELHILVECYAGHRGEETPSSFQLGKRRIEVMEVIDRWLAPDDRYFKVRGDDGSVYILRHDVTSNRWELTMFER